MMMSLHVYLAASISLVALVALARNLFVPPGMEPSRPAVIISLALLAAAPLVFYGFRLLSPNPPSEFAALADEIAEADCPAASNWVVKAARGTRDPLQGQGVHQGHAGRVRPGEGRKPALEIDLDKSGIERTHALIDRFRDLRQPIQVGVASRQFEQLARPPDDFDVLGHKLLPRMHLGREPPQRSARAALGPLPVVGEQVEMHKRAGGRPVVNRGIDAAGLALGQQKPINRKHELERPLIRDKLRWGLNAYDQFTFSEVSTRPTFNIQKNLC